MDLFSVSCSSISKDDIDKQESLVIFNLKSINLGSELSLGKYQNIFNSFLKLQEMYSEYIKQKVVD